MFNALRVPLSLKSVITVAPAVVYLIVRDLQIGGKIDKLISQERERNKPADTAKPAEEKI
ncbi:MAG: hypothetical protein MUF81_06640 [Verrucomicrobia bacterium]|nr:hypothetical protein [Verrucomicrobiota bacterium]